MAKVPECVVCLQQFDDFRHVPRVLACGHSFCELCLMQLQSAWQPSPAKTRTPPTRAATSGAVIRCPECSHCTRLPVGGQQSLPKNVVLLRLLPSLIADEADSVTGAVGQDDTGKKLAEGTLREPEGNGSSGRAPDSRSDGTGGAGGGAVQSSGSKRAFNPSRRLIYGKGKEIESSGAGAGAGAGGTSNANYSRMDGAATVGGSWVLPCDVISGNVKDDLRNWIIPKDAIKLNEEVDTPSSSSGRSTPGNCSCRKILRGELTFERDQSSLSRSWPISLVPIESVVSCSTSIGQREMPPEAVYEDSVIRAWNGLHRWVKTELLLLFRISMLSHRVCTILGLWRNNGSLYLVSQSPTYRPVPAREKIMNAKCEGLPDDDDDDVGGDHSIEANQDEEVSGRDIQREPSGERKLEDLDFRQMLGGQVNSRVRVEAWSRMGASICELLHNVHSQGLIIGVIGPNCFTADIFGNLFLDMNSALLERFLFREAAAFQGFKNIGRLEFGNLDIREDRFLKSKNCWQYVSPEVLFLLSRGQDLDGKSEVAENGSSSLGVSDDMGKRRLTCKADVWSVGCLLLELATGRPPYGETSLADIRQRVCVEREKPESLSSLVSSKKQETCDSDDGYQGLLPHVGEILLKCFEYDPELRPDMKDLWIGLTEFFALDSGFRKNFVERTRSQPHPDANLKQWMLVLSGFVSDGGQELDMENPQRQLELLALEDGSTDNAKELRVGLAEEGFLDGHRDYVTAMVVCGDNLLSASFDKTINVWSLEDHTLQKTLEGHAHIVTALAVDQETCRCFSGDNDAKICAWTLDGDTNDSKALLASWKVHNDWRYTGVTSLAVSPDGILYSGSGDKTIKAWSLLNFDLLGAMEGHNGLVSALLVDGQLLYSGSWDGTIRAWWRDDHSSMAVLGSSGPAADPTLGGVRTLCMSDSFLFAGRESGVVQVWRDEECLATITAHNDIVSALYVEGDFLYTGSWDQQIKAWKVGEILSEPSPTVVRNCNAALSSIVSDGDRLYASLSDSAIKVYTLLGDTWASLVQMLNP